MSAIVKELLKLDSRPICQSYAQMKKGLVFLTHSISLFRLVGSTILKENDDKLRTVSFVPVRNIRSNLFQFCKYKFNFTFLC